MTRSPFRMGGTAALLLVALAAARLHAADGFEETIRPFVQKHCVRCHNAEKTRGELDLTRYSRADDLTADFRHWQDVVEFVRNGKMPPPEEQRQPTLKERRALGEAVEAILLAEARAHAGDPGVVLPRRLSRAEYDASVRDLTGVDMRPTKRFPADPAGGEGFDNTGEALSMSPSLLKKYLQAAQHVANHLVLKTDGITFAPFPVTSYNERKKLTEQAVIDFYDAHRVEVGDYLEAAWRYRYRNGAERGLGIEQWAERSGLSGKYLALVWETLEGASTDSVGYVKQLGARWESLPAPKGEGRPDELRELERFVDFCRERLGHPRERLIKSNAGNWPIGHLDFRATVAGRRDEFAAGNLRSLRDLRFDRVRAVDEQRKQPDEPPRDWVLRLRVEPAFPDSGTGYVILHRPLFSRNGNPPRNEKDREKHEVETLRSVLERHAPQVAKRLAFGRHPRGHEIDEDSFALEVPGTIEIPLDPELRQRLDGKHLLVECELDPEHAPEAAVHLTHTSGDSLGEDDFGNDIALLMHPESELAGRFAGSAERFCRAFPNRFFYVDDRRGLAAGFHLVEGFFRDDRPLVEKVLDEGEQRELDRLWDELRFVTNSAEVLLRGFVWFERSERHVLHDERFDFLRPEDPRLVEEELLGRFEREYLDKMGVRLKEGSLEPEQPNERYEMIHGFFQRIRTGLAERRQRMAAAEGQALEDLRGLARRAYRRSLTSEDVASLERLYGTLREQGQDVEHALRGVFVAVLMSPDFLYRVRDVPPGRDTHPLSDHELASRLSYFLWSSIPDEELLAAAESGRLQDADVLVEQTRRMLRDPRTSGFAREFFGQWLRYRDFPANDPIVAEAFPQYDDELRQAMFEEPTRLATWLIREDRPVTDLLNSDTTFVNGRLAEHYGGAIHEQYRTRARQWEAKWDRRDASQPSEAGEIWHRVDGLREAGRGGLFGMAVILAKNSAGERTSPVKRGFWTVHHLLGQHFPPPPADVPELPASEKKAEKSIRELLAEHAANPRCAMCHEHFDGLGLALEGFDPIGRARTKDAAGRPVDDVAKLPGGETARGAAGLIDYVATHRRDDFVRTLCRKFLGYALGRSVLLSDQPLLEEMQASLEANDYRFSALFETVVRSRQFREQRGRDFTAASR